VGGEQRAVEHVGGLAGSGLDPLLGPFQRVRDGVERLHACLEVDAGGGLGLVGQLLQQRLTAPFAWDAWPDARSWGVLLADLAKHVANAREQEMGEPAHTTLAEIRLAFDDQWGWDTDSVEGSVST